ncbi:MAG: rRNA adenine dimethyltransferase family protein [Patescibacteria group bacterium]|nr:rRNA adenine dimethyltransferase family protein [Patescibacteria group bacterium]
MRQKLGQHFLKNKKYLGKIVDNLLLKEKDVVIEIGSGHGELTFEIINKLKSLNINNFKIFAIEKDPILAKKLKMDIENLTTGNKIEIFEGDVLKQIPIILSSEILDRKSYKLVGNIPYYLTGFLFRFLGGLKNKPKIIVFTVQKEVAQRIVSKPPKMNILAASIKFWSAPKIIDFVPRNNFLPMPKVDSAIIKLDCAEKINPSSKESKDYYQLVKILFKQPRKTILNNILSDRKTFLLTKKERIAKKIINIGISPLLRPQNLSIENIKNLSRILYN